MFDTIETALASSEFAVNPHPLYHRMRREAPVHWSPSQQQWLVTSYDLVDEVLGDPETFSSVGAEISHVGKLDEPTRAATPVLWNHFATPQLNITDPPDHTRIRRAFGRSFLPRNIARFEEQIADAAIRLVDAAATDAGLDVVADLAEPLPVEVIATIMGVPESHRHRIPVVTLDQRHFFGTSPPTAAQARDFDSHLSEWHDLLSGWMDERRHTPGDDVFTRAAEAVDAGNLTLDEAVATCLHLVIAGNSTTTALIGNAAYALLSRPDQLQLLRDDPSLLPNCIEETLRVEPPLPRDRRIATRDCRLGGADVLAGDRVSAVLAAANRDPAHFSDPDRFDITRSFTVEHHATFGRGIHFCLGAPVARLEAAVAIAELLRRFPDLRLAPGFEPDWHAITTHHGLTTLPVVNGRRVAVS